MGPGPPVSGPGPGHLGSSLVQTWVCQVEDWTSDSLNLADQIEHQDVNMQDHIPPQVPQPCAHHTHKDDIIFTNKTSFSIINRQNLYWFCFNLAHCTTSYLVFHNSPPLPSRLSKVWSWTWQTQVQASPGPGLDMGGPGPEL